MTDPTVIPIIENLIKEYVNYFNSNIMISLYKIILGTLVLIITYKVNLIIPKLLNKFKKFKQLDALFDGTVRTLLWLFGILLSMYYFGFDVASIITSLGLIAFGLGLALKDIVLNLISGIMIILYRPFKKGDLIIIDKYEGKVRSIDLRYTTLYELKNMDENDVVLMPNSTLLGSPVTVKHVK